MIGWSTPTQGKENHNLETKRPIWIPIEKKSIKKLTSDIIWSIFSSVGSSQGLFMSNLHNIAERFSRDD